MYFPLYPRAIINLNVVGYQSIINYISGLVPTGNKALLIFFVNVPSLLPIPAVGINTCVIKFIFLLEL